MCVNLLVISRRSQLFPPFLAKHDGQSNFCLVEFRITVILGRGNSRKCKCWLCSGIFAMARHLESTNGPHRPSDVFSTNQESSPKVFTIITKNRSVPLDPYTVIRWCLARWSLELACDAVWTSSDSRGFWCWEVVKCRTFGVWQSKRKWSYWSLEVTRINIDLLRKNVFLPSFMLSSRPDVSRIGFGVGWFDVKNLICRTTSPSGCRTTFEPHSLVHSLVDVEVTWKLYRIGRLQFSC